MNQKFLRSKLDNFDTISNLLSVLIANKMSESIFRKKLFVLTANDPFYFVLPDCGVMIYDFEDDYDYFLWPYGWDVAKPSVSVIFPVSPARCLVYGGFDLRIEELNDCFVKEAIILAYHQNHNYIYSDRKNKYIQDNINTFPLKNLFE